MGDIHYYEPRHGHGLKHDPFNAIVGPRPIGWISTVSKDGVRNLAPYSFFNAFCYVPPIVGFSSIGWKDTVANIQETREFTWNLATKHIAEKMNMTSATVPHEVDEFTLAGLTKAPSRLVAVPRVAESFVSFECRLTQMIRLAGADGRDADDRALEHVSGDRGGRWLRDVRDLECRRRAHERNSDTGRSDARERDRDE